MPSDFVPRSRAASVCAVALVLFAGVAAEPARACTTGVVSGRATPDGRPLLWKNRDTKQKNNQVVYSDEGRYAYVGVINAGSSGGVWMGVNAAGFCIENSLIKDMPGGSKSGMGNGAFMKHALETCATIEEFEALLNKTNDTGRRTMSNYGVIDAEGGAAIFETGHVSYVKFDANCPETAPQGFVVRSNFTMTGTGNEKLAGDDGLNDVYSGERYLRAEALFRRAADKGTLDHRFILRHCSRDLADAECRPYPGSVNGPQGTLPGAIDTASTICRRTTVSVAVFHGVRRGEDPLLTTMWVMLGEPAFSVAVPCWVGAGEVAPALKGGKRSPLCSTVLAIRKSHYDEKGKLLTTERLPSLWQRTWPVEDRILRETQTALARRRADPPQRDELAALHHKMVARAMQALGRVTEKRAAPLVMSDD